MAAGVLHLHQAFPVHLAVEGQRQFIQDPEPGRNHMGRQLFFQVPGQVPGLIEFTIAIRIGNKFFLGQVRKLTSMEASVGPYKLCSSARGKIVKNFPARASPLLKIRFRPGH